MFLYIEQDVNLAYSNHVQVLQIEKQRKKAYKSGKKLLCSQDEMG